ncbi:MAG: hypothetical protein IKH45_02490 [Neisseriaceae bacterium]|nr:hypothetical protein [Neisseriaceae bacterium]
MQYQKIDIAQSRLIFSGCLKWFLPFGGLKAHPISTCGALVGWKPTLRMQSLF